MPLLIAAMAVPTDTEILNEMRTAALSIASGGASSYSINGRSWSALNIRDLLGAIQVQEALVARRTRRMFAGITFMEAR